MLENAAYFDISPALTDDLAVFPGDTPLKRQVQLSFNKGDNLALSSLTMSSHLGAHVDAPNHYHSDGCGIGERDLRYYFGSCQVISVKKSRGERIDIDDIATTEIKANRVLFKTGSYPDPNRWNGDFNSLSSALIEYLAGKGVKLVGIDTPSIDLSEDKVLEAHRQVFKNDLAILEGIVLDQVSDGLYTLIALPLKISHGDASPVRAILIDNLKR